MGNNKDHHHPEAADSIIPCKVNSDYFTIAKPII